ncbi:MAG TPA: MFS transporter [Spirochaetia bacterium]|nr:MFS transporter [Spirochaetia bacterium]
MRHRKRPQPSGGPATHPGTNGSLLLLFPVVFMDMIGFGFIIPLLPDYAERFGGTPMVVGLLMAVYAAGQFVAAPLLGRLSDRLGRRPVFLLSIAGSLASMVILAFSRSIGVLFLSRVVGGLAGGNFTVAQSYAADVTDEENRARGLGVIGAAFGMGFVVGPLFGGILVNFGFSVPPLVAAGLSAINLLMVSVFLPESLPAERGGTRTRSSGRLFPLARLGETLRKRPVGDVLAVTFVYGLAFTMFEMIFSLFAQKRLGLSAQVRSYVLGYVGVLLALVQGGGIGLLTKRFEERKLILVSAAVMSISVGLWAFSTSILYLLIVLAPLSLAAGIITTLLRSVLSKSVAPEDVGGTLGLSNSLDSLNRVISPAIGGLMIGGIGTWAPGVLGALLLSGATVLIWVKLVRRKAPVTMGDGT